jgi:hypothetical protein
MQKVSLFARFPTGDTMYRNEFCGEKTTIQELMSRNKLPSTGATIFVNGTQIKEQSVKKPIELFKAGNIVFVSIRYLERD